ncbi:ribosomal protein S18-alanine N-acetyltransferase [Limosilactobacillus sp.]|uniref:ribosomal protein S18-alanine N-acetyltransferase n=1 Tax=Limosilactobacillus sp. TaxID=2773925 RepID=UPI003F02701F
MFEKFKSWCRVNINGRKWPMLDFARRVVVIKHHQYVVRMASEQDIKTMVDIERAIYGDAPWSYAAFQIELRRPQDRLYLVIVDDGQVVGFLGMAVDWYRLDLHITNVGVTPGYQQKGIGTYLISTALNYACHTQLRSVSLEVRVHNLVARKLYEQLGFREREIKHRYYLDNHEDAIDMAADLLNKGEVNS